MSSHWPEVYHFISIDHLCGAAANHTVITLDHAHFSDNKLYYAVYIEYFLQNLEREIYKTLTLVFNFLSSKINHQYQIINDHEQLK